MKKNSFATVLYKRQRHVSSKKMLDSIPYKAIDESNSFFTEKKLKISKFGTQALLLKIQN